MARAILGPHYDKYSQVLTAEDEAVLNQLQAKYKASLESAAATPAETVVDPWSVVGAVDYVKLTRDFGSVLISDALMDRCNTFARPSLPFSSLNNPPPPPPHRWQRIMGPEKPMHPWLRRGIFYSHRDLCVLSPCISRAVSSSIQRSQGPNSRLRRARAAVLPVHRPRPFQRVASHGSSRAISVH